MQGLMTSSGSVLRPTVAQDSSGGSVKTFSEVYPASPCRVQPYRAEKVVDFMRYGMRVSHRIHFCPALPDVRVQDVVSVDGDTYEVKGVFDPDRLGRFTVAEVEKYGTSNRGGY